MKTSLPRARSRRLYSLPCRILIGATAGWLAFSMTARAEKFSTAPQREAIDNAVGELDKATEKAAKAQEKAPTDAGQQGINGAEDAADAARDAANRANDAAETAREEAAEKAKTAKSKEEIKDARDAERRAKEAADRARDAEKTAKDRDTAAKKEVDDQVKADEGKNKNRRIVHEARQAKRDARRRLADRVRELRRAWAEARLDPKKQGVTITEDERRRTERKVNEGRRELGWEEIEILASRTPLPADTLSALVASKKVQTEIVGTGKTIGHVASLHLKNVSPEKITVTIPPLVLESASGKHQHYVCPTGETVTLNPREEKVVEQRGVCIARSKPPVGEGVGKDLVINDGSGIKESRVFTPAQVDKLIRCTTAYYAGADKLEKEGKLAKVPYKDPEMRREIVTQWGIWSDPGICKVTKETPATKEDLSKTVHRQAEEHTPLTPETRKKLDTGITDIFTSIQLTTKEAKELEPASPFEVVEVSGGQPGDEAPAPEPQERTETAINADGSRTTTTTRTDSSGNTTTTSTTEYSDETTRTVTTVQFKSGATTSQTVERDGSSTTTHNTTDDEGTKITATNTIDKKTGSRTDTTITVDKDGSKTTKVFTTERDGRTKRSRETINPDGSKETFKKELDDSWTWSSTDKNGQTTTTSGDGKGGKVTGSNNKGKYTVEKQPDGSQTVHWDLPNGTGGTKSFAKGTDISPNTDEDTNPLPFKAGQP